MPQEPEESLVGTILCGRYGIISLVGRGGIGVVYKARHMLMDRIVAIKMLKRNFASDNTSMLRFQQEAKTASNLTHQNVIGVHDFGISDDGLPYLVMDYLEGTSLADIIREEGAITPERAISLFTQTCAGLHHAHQQGVVHRDVKPSNLMIIQTPHGECVKIVDFGMAKLISFEGQEGLRLTATGDVLGSPLYMSPEQCTGEPLDARSDLYSLGCTMYEALMGQTPLMGNTAMDTMYKHLKAIPLGFHEERPDLKIPPQLEMVVFKALEKDPRRRYQSMLELQQALEKVDLNQGSSLISVLSRTSRRLRRQIQEKQALAMVVAFAAILIMVAPMVATLTTSQSHDPVTEYERLFLSGKAAMDRGDYSVAEEQMSAALKEAEKFEQTDARYLKVVEHLSKIREQKNRR